MKPHAKIGKPILRDYFKYYAKHSLDDVEYLPVVKTIINSVGKNMKTDGFEDTEIKNAREELIEVSKSLYVNRWLKQVKEDEDSPDLESETEAAQYYFEYVFEHEEHPR